MKPPVEHHISFLDYFRGAAILSVFFYHALGASFGTDRLPWVEYLRGGASRSFFLLLPATFGFVGVPIFFAVSGFCIHLSHQRSLLKSYRIFFLRRFFRIYPPYLLALLFFEFVLNPLWFGLKNNHLGYFLPSLDLKDLLSHLFLVHNFSDRFCGGINASFWSIAIEIQLYLLYPLLIWVAKHVGWQKTLWVTGLIELGLHGLAGLWLIPRPDQPLSLAFTNSPFCYWFSWSIGAALAEAYLRGEPLPFRSPLGFLWPVFFVGFYFLKPLSPFVFTMGALSSASAMAYGLSCAGVGIALNNNWGRYALEHLRWAGIVSYSAYLIHQPLVGAVPHLVFLVFHHHEPHPLLLYGICLCSWLPIFGLSYLFYRYVEQPSIALGKRVISQSRKMIPAQGVKLEATSAS